MTQPDKSITIEGSDWLSAEELAREAVWDALEGVTLRRPYQAGHLCLICFKYARRGSLPTCSPRCHRRWRRFLGDSGDSYKKIDRLTPPLRGRRL